MQSVALYKARRMTNMLKHSRIMRQRNGSVWGSPDAASTASYYRKTTPPYGHALRVEREMRGRVDVHHVALKEYAGERACPPSPV